MPRSPQSTPPVDVISDEPELSLDDVCSACGLTRDEIGAYVAEGIAEARGPTAAWRFSRLTVVRLSRARRLERDLGLNPAGALLALDLMAQIERLQHRLALFEDEG